MQTTGLFESGDALRNVLFDLKMPILAVVGARNWLNQNSKDTAKLFAVPILNAWGVAFQVVESKTEASNITPFLLKLIERNEPGIVLLGE